jgi:membrane protein DedA with SNARE-associated domain
MVAQAISMMWAVVGGRPERRTVGAVWMLAAVGDWVREAVASGGYLAVALLIFVENVFPPIPSEVILPLAGYYVGQGELDFVPAVAAATVGSVAGALVLYALARHGGRPLLLRHGRLLRLTEADLDRGDAWFDRHGPWLVFFGRLVPGVRSLVSVPAGLSEMPLGRFVWLTAAGSALWNAALIGAGWGLGSNWEQVGSYIGPLSTAVVALLVAGAAVWLVQRHRRRRRRRSRQPA